MEQITQQAKQPSAMDSALKKKMQEMVEINRKQEEEIEQQKQIKE